MEMGGELHAPAAFTPEIRGPCTPWIGGWMGHRADLDAVAKRKN
jgi:hypothetical protein